MNFASPFVDLAYNSDEDDLELSDNELQWGFDAQGFEPANSDDEDEEDAGEGPGAPMSVSSVRARERRSHLLRCREERQSTRSRRVASRTKASTGPSPLSNSNQRASCHVNTNVVSVPLGELADAADHVQTGDPVFCGADGCRCVFSAVSKLLNESGCLGARQLEEGQRIWVCEFCGRENVVDIEDEEMPKGQSQDYILEPAPMKIGVKDERIVIFCIDISTSMRVTQEVPGSFKLKCGAGVNLRQQRRGDAYDPYRNTTHVSRLQAVQAAVGSQLKALQETCPNYTVGLVTFSSEVTIYGDGGSMPVFVAGDKLKDLDKLLAAGRKCALKLPIIRSRTALTERVFGLRTSRHTALGPALAVSVAMASVKNGSKVIVCTDGEANRGVGALGLGRSSATKWYEGLGILATTSGVTVDVISISRDECQLETVGRVADITQGKVDKIDMLDIATNFTGILQNPVVATNVNATMRVHRGLRLRDDRGEDTDEEMDVGDSGSGLKSSSSASSSAAKAEHSAVSCGNSNGSQDREVGRVVRDVGNVNSETEMFFEYSVRKGQADKCNALAGGLPFQVQIRYTRLDGARCIRVVTQVQEVTMSKALAEGSADVSIIAAHGARKSAELAQEGDYESSRRVNLGHALYMDRIASAGEQQQVLSRYVSNVSAWDRRVQRQLEGESSSGISYSASSHADRSYRSDMRASTRHDHISRDLYAMKSMSSMSMTPRSAPSAYRSNPSPSAHAAPKTAPSPFSRASCAVPGRHALGRTLAELAREAEANRGAVAASSFDASRNCSSRSSAMAPGAEKKAAPPAASLRRSGVSSGSASASAAASGATAADAIPVEGSGGGSHPGVNGSSAAWQENLSRATPRYVRQYQDPRPVFVKGFYDAFGEGTPGGSVVRPLRADRSSVMPPLEEAAAPAAGHAHRSQSRSREGPPQRVQHGAKRDTRAVIWCPITSSVRGGGGGAAAASSAPIVYRPKPPLPLSSDLNAKLEQMIARKSDDAKAPKRKGAHPLGGRAVKRQRVAQ